MSKAKTKATVSTKVEDYKPSKTVFDRALGAIKLHKRIAQLIVLLEADKDWLKKNGDVGKTIQIPGHGSVQIKSGTAAKEATAYTSYAFSPEKFEALSDARKAKMIEAGVVTITSGINPAKPAGDPTIAFVHNE